MEGDGTYLREGCRVCGSTNLWKFLDLDAMPPANGFRTSLENSQSVYPLVVVKCESCDHVQLQHTVDRTKLFSEYPYHSSASGPLQQHFVEYANEIESLFLDPGDFVVEIGSNDGVLLREFNEDIQVLGVDPAENVAAEARKFGVETISKFFSLDVAKNIRSNNGRADAILANNVVGHIDDLNELLTGVKALLKDDGVFVLEVRYLVDLLNSGAFESIYHEHLSYFSIRSMKSLVERNGMELAGVERIDIHGGSFRAYITPELDTHSFIEYLLKRANDLIDLELSMGLDGKEPYEEFTKLVDRRRHRIKELLDRLKKPNTMIVGYGAPAKGNVFLNFCDIGTETLDYIVDTTPAKQGSYAPGTNIPIRPPKAFQEDEPDYALLLAWNYKNAILEKEADYREKGGQFILPAPHIDIP